MSQSLFVCSGGGHLKQMFTLSSRLGVAVEDQHWATFDNALSRSILEGRRVTYIPFAGPRDVANSLRSAMIARRILMAKGADYSSIFSTGSSPAVSFLPLAALMRIPAHYIESATRVDGPSLTGKIMSITPGVKTYAQYREWATGSWRYGGSIFDGFRGVESTPITKIRKAVVSIGTQDGYPFGRLIEHLSPLLQGAEVLWQTGTTDVTPYGIDGHHSVPHKELSAAVAEADLVVAHSGTGAALTAIQAGKMPVLVPRRVAFKEHIDEHQGQLARSLAARGLAIACEADQLTEEVLLRAASSAIDVIAAPVPFRLDAVGGADSASSEQGALGPSAEKVEGLRS